jgi:Flp pilus assembly protein TadG
MKQLRSDRGATAVEFALVMLPLLLLLMGVIDFGTAYHTKLSMTAAAREGVRVMAIEKNEANARTTILDFADLDPAPAISFQPTVCPTVSPGISGTDVSVTVTYSQESLTGFFGTFDLQAEAKMRCSG